MDMRHIVRVLVLLLCLAIPMSGLVEVDLSSMSYEELLSLQRQVSQELRLKEPVNGNLIYDNGSISIHYLGISEYGFITELQFQIVNASDKNIEVVFKNVSVNDFSMNSSARSSVSKGKKAISVLELLNLGNIVLYEIENIELSIVIYDDQFRTIESSEPIILFP